MSASVLSSRDYAPVVDYLVEGYGVPRRDVSITNGSKHNKLQFPWEGRTITMTIPRAPNDEKWAEVKQRDIRMALGEPRNQTSVERSRRTLEEMTDEVKDKVQQSHIPIVDSTPGIQPTLAQTETPKRWPVRVAVRHYAGTGATVEVVVPHPLYEEMMSSAALPGFAVEYVSSSSGGVGLFTVRRTSANSPRPVRRDFDVLFKCGAAAIYGRLGAFYATPGEGWLSGGALRIELTESPRKVRVVASKVQKVEVQAEDASSPYIEAPLKVEDSSPAPEPSTISFVPDPPASPKLDDLPDAPLYSVTHGDLSVAVSVGKDGGLKIMANAPRGGLLRLVRVLGKIEETMSLLEGDE